MTLSNIITLVCHYALYVEPYRNETKNFNNYSEYEIKTNNNCMK